MSGCVCAVCACSASHPLAGCGPQRLETPRLSGLPLALALTVLLALFYWKSPGTEVLTGGLEGAVMALWPISLVIVAAVFTYNLTVRTGAMGASRGCSPR